MKRYRYIILFGILFLGILIYYGTYRIISINVGEKWVNSKDYFDIKNTINIFDTTKIHNIKILITEKEYEDMIDSFIITSQKKWYKVDIVIDGVTIHDIGIRLKGRQKLLEMKGDKKSMLNAKLGLFVKFNKYINQTYQGHEMIVLRIEGIGSDEKLLAEPYSYELYQEFGQPAPDTSYGAVEIDGKEPALFIISEIPEDKHYIEKWFGDDNGILYKAGNFVDFSYQGENPTLYSDYFIQKTRVNDYDLSPLIRMLKFVTESEDDEFEEKIEDYIDVESFLINLAIDKFMCNLDSFGGNVSNFYLYYDLKEKKFYLLTWDHGLVMRGDCNLAPSLRPNWMRMIFNGKKRNVLQERLLSNIKFKEKYDEIYVKIGKIALNSDFSENFFKERINAFYQYNLSKELVSESTYLELAEKLKDYLDNKRID